MRILFDHNVPRQLRRHLSGHSVDVASGASIVAEHSSRKT